MSEIDHETREAAAPLVERKRERDQRSAEQIEVREALALAAEDAGYMVARCDKPSLLDVAHVMAFTVKNGLLRPEEALTKMVDRYGVLYSEGSMLMMLQEAADTLGHDLDWSTVSRRSAPSRPVEAPEADLRPSRDAVFAAVREEFAKLAGTPEDVPRSEALQRIRAAVRARPGLQSAPDRMIVGMFNDAMGGNT
jgi:hypothetical protein